jgi:MerR family transcriptional regulator/heat shock protein HspR
VRKAGNFMNKPLVESDRPIFPISEVAQQLKVHPRTLRIYDEEKILCPERSPRKRRLYSINNIREGKFIQYLTKELGLSLIGVKITLELLKKLDVSPDNYYEIIQEISLKYNINQKKQDLN